jgi:uncharacterized membrane protein
MRFKGGCMMEKNKLSTLTIVLLIVITVLAFSSALIRIVNSDFGNLFLPPIAGHSGGLFYEVIVTLLTIVVDVLYLFGGGVIFFGAILAIVRFVQVKLQNPYKPSGVARALSGYLTLSLELFIGAEIVKTATTQSFTDLETLILIILSRGLFSLILYFERKWRGSETETE